MFKTSQHHTTTQDVSLDYPFGGDPDPADQAGGGPCSRLWGEHVMKGQEHHEQRERSEQFSKEQGQEMQRKPFSEAEVAGTTSEEPQGRKYALIR